jgi:hypothetical protein
MERCDGYLSHPLANELSYPVTFAISQPIDAGRTVCPVLAEKVIRGQSQSLALLRPPFDNVIISHAVASTCPGYFSHLPETTEPRNRGGSF